MYKVLTVRIVLQLATYLNLIILILLVKIKNLDTVYLDYLLLKHLHYPLITTLTLKILKARIFYLDYLLLTTLQSILRIRARIYYS